MIILMVALCFLVDFTDSETTMKTAVNIALIAICGAFGIWWNWRPSVDPRFQHATTDHLVIRCMDTRIRKITDHWIAKNLGDDTDLLAWPGVTPGFQQNHVGELLLDAIRLAQNRHGVRNLHLVSHHDCAGHGGFERHGSIEQEMQYHKDDLERTAATIRGHFPDLIIHLYFADARGVHPL